MPSFMIKVQNNDEGEDLGAYESDYVPRAGEPLVLWHPRVCRDNDHPFCGIVAEVTHEAFNESHPYAKGGNKPGVVTTIVWLTEEHAAPDLFCDCTAAEQLKLGDVDGWCENCGHARKPS